MTDHALSLSPSIPTFLETKSDHCRLRIRFNRLSKERRLLTCLLTLFAIIMCGLLIGIFILSWGFQGKSFSSLRRIFYYLKKKFNNLREKKTFSFSFFN
jgi:hypothetical protein